MFIWMVFVILDVFKLNKHCIAMLKLNPLINRATKYKLKTLLYIGVAPYEIMFVHNNVRHALKCLM